MVCFWYDFKAALKMAWKREEAAAVEGVWDMGEAVTVEELRVIYLQVRVGTRKVTLVRWRTPPHGQAPQQDVGNCRCKRERV